MGGMGWTGGTGWMGWTGEAGGMGWMGGVGGTGWMGGTGWTGWTGGMGWTGGTGGTALAERKTPQRKQCSHGPAFLGRVLGGQKEALLALHAWVSSCPGALRALSLCVPSTWAPCRRHLPSLPAVQAASTDRLPATAEVHPRIWHKVVLFLKEIGTAAPHQWFLRHLVPPALPAPAPARCHTVPGLLLGERSCTFPILKFSSLDKYPVLSST